MIWKSLKFLSAALLPFDIGPLERPETWPVVRVPEL